MTTPELPTCPPPQGGRLVDAHLSILDRQVLDVDGEPVGVVDDLELDDLPDRVVDRGAAPPQVRNLVHGPIVLNRIFGKRRPLGHIARVGWDTVAEIGSALRLAVRADTLDVAWLESWLADNVIARIPGGRHVPR
jgi:sporulation protein YlmC with PRC-barrel domain